MNSYAISAISAVFISFLITLFSGKIIIPYLHKLKYGQTILEIGPSWHKNKQGTPTMGGIMFIAGIVLSTSICVPAYYKISEISGVNATETPLMIIKIFAGLALAVAYGIVGLMDDYVKVSKRQNKGLTPKQKLILQFGIVGCYFLIIHAINKSFNGPVLTTLKVPFYGNLDLGIFYWLIFSVIVVGIVNAANLTDGIDGLCTSVTFFIALFCMVILNVLGMSGLSIEAAALAGGCLGFLFWNFHPAKVFMGDTGSLFLGGMVCALLMGANLYIPLIILSFVYIAEMFSVIIQVLYFKFTHGKRLFKMSPLHHHFEMCGWDEVKICAVFSVATIILGVLTTVMVIYGM
ncbi:MAG: phospho-N-acetylmuramoyl-pentapeptide-transferase [Acutalibacteraceae bacterium]